MPAVTERRTSTRPPWATVQAPIQWTDETTGPGLLRASAFPGSKPDTVQENILPVVVALYNEDANEVVATLHSLWQMEQEMREEYDQDFTLKVCIIQDGFKHASDTVKMAFEKIFPQKMYGRWQKRLQDCVNSNQKGTMILQSNAVDLGLLRDRAVIGRGMSCRLGDQLLGAQLDITLVAKADNRKKHNSHDLFFRGFACHLNARFGFATDCGTLFHPACLRLLYARILKEDQCIAVSGRQRVMTRDQQPDCETEGFKEHLLRCVQGFDYEASTVVFNGCFSLFGVMAVVPGPCGLFRLEPLLRPNPERDDESPFDFYMRAAHDAEKNEPDVMTGNCILAEDRVLTYAALYLSDVEGGATIYWVPKALFYFQSERSLVKLVSQRRRWLNGTVAGYLYVHHQLQSRDVQWKHPCWKICLVRWLCRILLLIYGGIAVSPALYVYGFWESVRYLGLMASRSSAAIATPVEMGIDTTRNNFTTIVLNISNNLTNVTKENSTTIEIRKGVLRAIPDEHHLDDSMDYLMLFACLLYFLLFFVFSWKHHKQAHDHVLFALATVVNAFVAILMVSALIVAFMNENSWVQWASVVYIGVPVFFNLLIPNCRALWLMFTQFVPFLLFMPTMQGYFLTLAIARTFDLRWGNRAGVGEEVDKLRSISQEYMTIQWFLNGVVVFLAVVFHRHLWFNAALGLCILAPTALICIGSLYHILGRRVFPAGLVVAACLRILHTYHRVTQMPFVFQMVLLCCAMWAGKNLHYYLRRCFTICRARRYVPFRQRSQSNWGSSTSESHWASSALTEDSSYTDSADEIDEEEGETLNQSTQAYPLHQPS